MTQMTTSVGQPLRLSHDEVAFYERAGEEELEHIEDWPFYRHMMQVAAKRHRIAASFPKPRLAWIEAKYDSAAEWDCYRHLAPMIAGKRVVQLGGKGAHAVKLLLANACEAWLLTPVAGEAKFARVLAEHAGVADRLRCEVGVAEDMPFDDGMFDAAISAGCVHHMTTDIAFPEIARTLRPGGRFAACDPWRAPLYGIGTRLMGRRESHDYCRPLTPERAEPLRDAFPRSRVIHHGALSRYPLLAADKLGVHTPLAAVWAITCLDDLLCSALRARRWGSSVALLATR